MTVAELAVILDHLPPSLPVQIAGKGECWEARVHHDHWGEGVYLDVSKTGTLRLTGRFRDKRTLDVRLEALRTAGIVTACEATS